MTVVDDINIWCTLDKYLVECVEYCLIMFFTAFVMLLFIFFERGVTEFCDVSSRECNGKQLSWFKYLAR